MAPDAQPMYAVSSAYSSSEGSSAEALATRQAALKGHGLEGKELQRVLAVNEAWDFAASEDGWVKAHNAVRLDMNDIAQAVGAVVERLRQGQAVQPWVVGNLHRYFPKFVELVHHHHDNEEELVAPELKKLGCIMPDKMSTDHVGLLQALTDLDGLFKGLKPGQPASEDLATFSALQSKFETFKRDMEEHLLEEEEVCLPIMRKCITKKQFKPIEKKIIAKASPELLGWILRAFPNVPAARQWMTDVTGIPAPVQVLVMLPALKKFRNNWSRLLEEVKAGERIPPEPTGCFGC